MQAHMYTHMPASIQVHVNVHMHTLAAFRPPQVLRPIACQPKHMHMYAQMHCT